MSKKLNKTIKNQIQEALIKHTFNKKLVKIADKKAKFALKVYNDVYPKKHREIMETCPEGWLKKQDSMAVSFCNSFTHLYFNGSESHYNCHNRVLKGRDRVFFLVPGSGYNAKKAYDGEHKLSVEHAKLMLEEDELHKELHEASGKAEAVIGSVTTIKKLISVWPEIEEFIPESSKREATNLPAFPIEDLNKSFGLKAKEIK